MMLTDIEQAIVNAVHGLNRDYIRSVMSYGGQLDDALTESVRLFPAVWVAFARATPVRAERRGHFGLFDLSFALIVGARSPRNEQSTRHGSDVGGNLTVGSYQLLNDVYAAIGNKTLNLDLMPDALGRQGLIAGDVATLFNTKLNRDGLSVLAQTYTCRAYLFGKQDSEAEQVPLLSIKTDYISPPDTVIGEQIIDVEQ